MDGSDLEQPPVGEKSCLLLGPLAPVSRDTRLIRKFVLARAISPSVSAAKCLRALADCVHSAGLAPARPNVIRFADAHRYCPRRVALRDPNSAVRLPTDPISSNTAVPNLL